MAKHSTYRNIVDARPTKPLNRRKQPRVPSALSRFLRFTGSSLTCTLLDQLIAGLLFVTLREPLRGKGFLRILIGTVVARIFSLTVNYVLNHRLVFVGSSDGDEDRRANRPSHRESLPRFLALAAGILTLSILGVYLLHTFLGVQESVAKLLMDSALFFVNYYLQRKWVFTTEPSIRPKHARRRTQGDDQKPNS